jgi:hypothetical protein
MLTIWVNKQLVPTGLDLGEALLASHPPHPTPPTHPPTHPAMCHFTMQVLALKGLLSA